MKYNELRMRTIAKTISWRVLLTASHIINGLIVTGSLMIGLQIAGLAAIMNSVLYWLHERAWNIFQWNRKDKEETDTFVEGNPRTVSKIVTWRILITVSNFIIPFIMTGSFGQAVLFAGLATVVNMALYYTHERLWNMLNWGKDKII